MPGPRAFAVGARSMSSGFLHGLLVSIGIVGGDFVFILLAISGVSVLV